MQAFTAFARFVTNSNLWIARIMKYMVLFLFLMLLSDVVMRKLVGSPMQWSADMAKLVFGVYAILGGGYLLARREHVNVDLFYANFSPKRKAVIDIIGAVLFFLLLGVLLKESYHMAYDSVSRWEVSHLTTWRTPLWPSKCLIVVAAILLFLQGFFKFAADVMVLFGIEPDKAAFGPVNEDGVAEKETL